MIVYNNWFLVLCCCCRAILHNKQVQYRHTYVYNWVHRSLKMMNAVWCKASDLTNPISACVWRRVLSFQGNPVEPPVDATYPTTWDEERRRQPFHISTPFHIDSEPAGQLLTNAAEPKPLHFAWTRISMKFYCKMEPDFRLSAPGCSCSGRRYSFNKICRPETSTSCLVADGCRFAI